MNGQEMMRILDSIARDRGVERDVLIADLETAMVSAARKHFNTLDTEEFTCELDRLTGELRLFRHGEAVNMTPESFGRIAAQTFKQVMIQKFREDERQSLFEEFSSRVGEIVTGTAQRYEGGALVVTIDRAEGFMPRSEQIPGEQFQAGDRIRCMILDVRDAGNQVKIVLSRANPDFIRRLFEVEVPEVAERIIEIKAMAREPGHRTKVAVSSIDSKVDAVGACVGVRGSRIKNIVDELNGEKIDIVRWNESSQVLIQNSLKPAEVAEISLCFELGRATVVVNDDQLSLAIGKRGQNVRLAARLTGWDIDILTPAEFNRGLETMAETLGAIPGLSEEALDRMAAMGLVSVFDVEEVGPEVLTAELEIERVLADEIVAKASEKAKQVAEQQAREKEENERKRIEEQAAARALLESGTIGEDVSPDIAAAAILSAGLMPRPNAEVPTDPARLEGLSGGRADRNAESSLSGGEVVRNWPAPEPARPDHTGEASPLDAEEPDTDDAEITDAALRDVMSRGERPGDAPGREPETPEQVEVATRNRAKEELGRN